MDSNNPITLPTCLIDLSVSPLSSRELSKVRDALRHIGITPEWLHTIEQQNVYFLQLRSELELPTNGEKPWAEHVATAIWKTIGRYVRIVVMFPELHGWPGGIEFGEAEYQQLLRR